MKTNSVKDLQFALKAIDKIYGLTDKDIQITGNGDSFRLTFFFTGKQQKNKCRYIGEPCKRYGSGLTLKMLYDTENQAGFRDWDWEDFKFSKNGLWYDSDDLIDFKIDRRQLKREYLKKAKVNESYGVRNAKYFILRYSRWISNKKGKPTPQEHIKINHLTGEKYDDRPGDYSVDGTKKYELETLDKIFVFALFGIAFAAEYDGDKDNPQIKLFNTREGLWIVNKVFLQYVVYKRWEIVLVSNPYEYYNLFTFTKVFDCMYARELEFLAKKGATWRENVFYWRVVKAW